MLSKKYLIGAMILLFLVVGLFSSVRMAKAQNVIKIGIFGPKYLGGAIQYPHWVAGMWSAAQMLAEQANAAGGWDVGGTKYLIEVYSADEYTHDYTNTAGIEASIDYLCKPPSQGGVGVNFIVGGFRTECVQYAIQYWHSAGYSESVPFLINGAATNELLSNTVGVNHDSWRHLYRIMPVNSTALFATFTASIKTYLCSDTGILTTLFGKGDAKLVKTAIIMEDAAWTNTMWYALYQNKTLSAYYLGPHVQVVDEACTRLPDGDTVPCPPQDIAAALTNVKNYGCNLLIHVFSGSTGKALMVKYNDLQVPALPVGINVVSQTQAMWTGTGGKCEYESHLMSLGTRTPLTPQMVKFWDDFLDWTGNYTGARRWPVYTAIGVGNAFITLKDAIETLDTLNIEQIHNYLCPRTNPGRTLQVLTGMSSFDNNHDVYQSHLDYSVYWTGNARAWVVQWLDGSLEVVYPRKYLNGSDIPFVKVWCLPQWMYTLIWDQNYNGYVGGDDITAVAKHFGARWTPPDP